MNQIKCTECGKIFKIDESGFAEIVKQVRDSQFEKEILEREGAWRERAEAQKMLAAAQAAAEIKKELDKEVSGLRVALAQKDAAMQAEIARKQAVITELEQKSKTEILKQQMSSSETIAAIKRERDDLLKAKDEEIARYKDYKARQSTKMVGESLELHCENEFNKLRAVGFQNSYFEKDNDVKDGTKGDYIFKEVDENGIEIISIMFEMKNEADETATKKKNEDFLSKLNDDRNKKSCEYAVLVSLLEIDNEFYNNGIVDMSHRYPKMYVVRPQFFIPIITLLRNAALKSQDVKTRLALIESQNTDVTHFEDELNSYKKDFNTHCNNAFQRFKDAIDDIDKAIAQLQKTKDDLLLTGGHLRKANNKLDEISVKKLTKNNPTMAVKFAQLNEKA